MRYAGLIGLGMLLTGCRGTPSTPTSDAAQSVLLGTADLERACCSAFLDEDAEMVLIGENGGGMMPMVCVQHKVGCPSLGVEMRVDATSAVDKAITHQVDLRLLPSCEKAEWAGRCPAGSTMLLANSRGGCAAAGCTPFGGAAVAATVEEGEVEDSAILRAVVAQEVGRLRDVTTGPVRTMYRHTARLRKAFAKDQRFAMKQLKEAMGSPLQDADDLRLLLERAALEGFSGNEVKQAGLIVEKHDRDQRAMSFMRRAPKVALAEAARIFIGVTREFGAKRRLVTGLKDQVDQLASTRDRLTHEARREERKFADSRSDWEREMQSVRTANRELEDEVSMLKARVRELEEAAVEAERLLQVEAASKTAASAAGDLARADFSACSARVAHLEEAAVEAAHVLQAEAAGKTAATAAGDLARADFSTCSARVAHLEEAAVEAEHLLQAEAASKTAAAAAGDLARADFSACSARVVHLEEAAVEAAHLLQAEAAGRTAATAAGDESRVALASCVGQVTDLEAVSKHLSGFVAKKFAGLNTGAHDRKASLLPKTGSSGDITALVMLREAWSALKNLDVGFFSSAPRMEQKEQSGADIHKSARARLAEVEVLTTAFTADVEEGLASCHADLNGVREELVDLRRRFAAVEEWARLAEEISEDIEEELESCLATVERPETRSTTADGSSDPPSCDCPPQALNISDELEAPDPSTGDGGASGGSADPPGRDVGHAEDGTSQASSDEGGQNAEEASREESPAGSDSH